MANFLGAELQQGVTYTVPTSNAGQLNFTLAAAGGGGVVTSVFGRTGAVVAATGDYDSGQVTNVSGVAGATVSAALNTLNTGKVASTTTLTTTSPLRIDGGNSADLSANRTLSVLAVGNANAGVAPQHAGAADVGKALVATATATAWSTNFGANDVATTGDISIGATPATTGDVRLAHGTTFQGRNNANSANLTLMSWGVVTPDVLRVGGPTYQLSLDSAGGGISILFGSVNRATIGTDFSLVTPNLQWLASVAAPTLTQLVDAAATVVAQTLSVIAQDVSGTTTVVGGPLLLRAGNAIGGAGSRTGGAASLASGSGATANGTLTLLVGASTVLAFNAAATVANFQGLQLVTTGTMSLGTTPASAGTLATLAAFTLNRRNFSNSGDTALITATGADDDITFGDPTGSRFNIRSLATTGQFRTGTTARMTITTSALQLTNLAQMNFNAGVDSQIQIDGTAILGFDRGSGTVRNLSLHADGSQNFQTGDKITFIADRVAAPTGNPAAGGFLYSESGALKWRGSGGTTTTIAPA